MHVLEINKHHFISFLQTNCKVIHLQHSVSSLFHPRKKVSFGRVNIANGKTMEPWKREPPYPIPFSICERMVCGLSKESEVLP